MVENYDTMIWTERYNTLGDFQLTSGSVDTFMKMLPEGTVLTLRDSTVPMIVETHEIVRKKNTGAVLTIKGREYTSILDRRIAIQSVAAALGEWYVTAKIPSDVAHYIMVQICVNGIVDVKDIFPSTKVQFITPSDYLNTGGPNREFNVARGNLLATVVGLLQLESPMDPLTVPPTPAISQHGIRAIRPGPSSTAIGIEIYVGTDRSASIYFDSTRDLLDDGRYLFSKVGSANTAYVLGSTLAAKMTQQSGATAPSGLDRRVILVDATGSEVQSEDVLRAEGSRAMGEAHVTALFDGSVNEDLSPYVYNIDYGLGDVVRTVGDYGLDQMSRVTEYIRSHDDTGLKSYPTLSALPLV
jgi:hypothetical protein